MSNPTLNLGKRLWQAWLTFGHWLGDIMSWVWMPLFYYVIATPFALYSKFILDPLNMRRKPQKSYWTPKQLPPLDQTWAESQGSIVTPTRS